MESIIYFLGLLAIGAIMSIATLAIVLFATKDNSDDIDYYRYYHDDDDDD